MPKATTIAGQAELLLSEEVQQINPEVAIRIKKIPSLVCKVLIIIWPTELNTEPTKKSNSFDQATC